jgi:hypothetical protein
MNVKITPGTLYLNLSPEGFHLWATHYLKCRRDFIPPNSSGFSPVPYFLLCRAIELEIKARLLKNMTQKDVKTNYGHDLIKAYNTLTLSEKILTKDEEKTLEAASQIYRRKSFEYLNNTYNVLTGYKKYPKLELLDSIANKLIKNI